ncbi:MAG TPA: hypothetical protein PK781_04815 [Terrimesophilobacter sp.]|nr:hypothetical protein [Terrimesophilobacter sp.]HRP99767.1 hypothetical protein [Terrimesophilobacter sp.]
MAGFDPFANQGGPAAWDPQHRDNSRELADKLLAEIDDAAIENEVKKVNGANEPTSDDDPYFKPEFTD